MLRKSDEDGLPAPAENDPEKVQRSVQSVEVGGRLLLTLSACGHPLGLKELAARSNLPPARAHPYLVSYIKLGLIEQDAATQRYALGPAALQIGLACLYQLDAVKTSSAIAEELAASTGRAVFVAVWANFGPTVVRLFEGSRALHVNMRVGTVMSLLGSATGRAFAASLPSYQLEQALSRPLGDHRDTVEKLSAGDRKLVKMSVEELRSHGVVRAVGRPIPGVNAFSAPAFNHDGEAVLVITAMGHEDTFSADWDSFMASSVRAASAQISARLGFRSSAQTRAA